MRIIEELGVLFKGDPTFDFIFKELPKSLFFEIVKIRRERFEKSPPLGDLDE